MTAPILDPIRSVAAFDPVMAARSLTLAAAAALMAENRCSALLADRRDGGVAIITEHDIVEALASGHSADTEWVTDVMTRDVVVISADTTIGDAAQLMLDAGIRHLIVEDRELGRRAIVSIRDLMGPLIDSADARSTDKAGERTSQ